MSHFTLIARDIDIANLLDEIDANPDLWNQRPERRTSASPHRETNDIWYRFATLEDMAEPGFTERPHKSVWWPAMKVTPSVVDVTGEVWDCLEQSGSLHDLGGILATRIPPGCQVYEHDDDIAWHARYYDMKVWVVLRGNDKCVNTVMDEEMVWKPGEAWHHDNLIRHSVRNEGETERIVLILCFRRA